MRLALQFIPLHRNQLDTANPSNLLRIPREPDSLERKSIFHEAIRPNAIGDRNNLVATSKRHLIPRASTISTRLRNFRVSLAIFSGRHDRVKVIWHKHRGEHAPFLKFCGGNVKCFKSRFIRQDGLPIRHANRDEVNYRLFPAQPHGNSWWVTHRTSLAGGAPALQHFYTCNRKFAAKACGDKR